MADLTSRVIYWFRRLLGLCVLPECSHSSDWTVLDKDGNLLEHDDFFDVGNGRVWVSPKHMRMVANLDRLQVMKWKCGKVQFRDLRFPDHLPHVSFGPEDSTIAEVLDE